MITKAIYL